MDDGKGIRRRAIAALVVLAALAFVTACDTRQQKPKVFAFVPEAAAQKFVNAIAGH